MSSGYDDQLQGLAELSCMLSSSAEQVSYFVTEMCKPREDEFVLPPDYFATLAYKLKEKCYEVDQLFEEEDGPPDSGGGEPMPILRVVNG